MNFIQKGSYTLLQARQGKEGGMRNGWGRGMWNESLITKNKTLLFCQAKCKASKFFP